MTSINWWWDEDDEMKIIRWRWFNDDDDDDDDDSMKMTRWVIEHNINKNKQVGQGNCLSKKEKRLNANELRSFHSLSSLPRHHHWIKVNCYYIKSIIWSLSISNINSECCFRSWWFQWLNCPKVSMTKLS